eukprot:evm.model.scf_1800.1 EVM.evm.TU.scf_1800.1   scf_1800:10901-11065(-)
MLYCAKDRYSVLPDLINCVLGGASIRASTCPWRLARRISSKRKRRRAFSVRAPSV